MAKSEDEVIIDVTVDGNESVTKAVKTLRDLAQANKELREERSKVDITTDAGRQKVSDLNAQIDRNNKIIKENSSNLEKQRLNVGNYTNSIVAAIAIVKQYEKANEELRKEQDALNKETLEGAQRYKQLEAAIEDNTKQIEEHTEAIDKAKKEQGLFGGSLGESIKGINIMGTSVGDLTGKLVSMLNPVTAGVGALGLLAGAYLKSSTGAKDMAFAQDRLNFLVDKTVESIGTLVAGKGENGNGALNKLISSWGTFLKYAPGINLLFRDQIDALFKESEAAALAAEKLRELQIEQQRAGNAAKTFESAAESARRIRDDQTKSYAERLKAINTISDNLNASQTVRVNVLNQEIAAIKAANVNWQNQNDIVVEIESKRREISDIEEEINGKRTENIMALNALQAEQFQKFKKEYEDDLKEFDKAQQAKVDAHQAALQTQFDIEVYYKEKAVKNWQDRQDKIRQISQEGVARLQNDLEKANNKRVKEEQDAARKQVQIDNFKNEAIVAGIDYVTEEKSAARILLSTLFRADAIKETIINTYDAAVAAYKAMASIPYVGPILGAAAAAAVGIFGAAKVAQISGITFAKGGKVNKRGKFRGPSHDQGGITYYGTDGNVIEVEGNENFYVLNKAASKEADKLSRLNQRHGGASFGTKVKYAQAGGQIATQQAINNAQSNIALAQAIRNNMPPIILTVEQFDAVANKKYAVQSRAKVIG